MRSRLEPLTGRGAAVPIQRARIVGAVRLEAGRHGRGAAMDRNDHLRSANTCRRTQPRRGVERIDRRGRQGLSGCRAGRFPSLLRRRLRRWCWCWCSAACTPGGQFDPTEVVSSDIFNTKKKIAGRTRAALSAGRAGRGDWRPAGFGEGLSAAAGARGASATGRKPRPRPRRGGKPKPKPKPKPKVAQRCRRQQAHDPAWDQSRRGAGRRQLPASGRAQSAWPPPHIAPLRPIGRRRLRRPILASGTARADELAGSAADAVNAIQPCARLALDYIHAGRVRDKERIAGALAPLHRIAR